MVNHGLGASVAMRIWHEWGKHQYSGQRDGKPLLLREVRLLFHKPSPVLIGRAGRMTDRAVLRRMGLPPVRAR
jgi:hypothetical protein